MTSLDLRRIVHLILASAALGSTLLSAHAWAEERKDAAGAVLAEVVVTAEKREVNLQKEPQAVSVVTGDMLEQDNLVTLSDLTGQVPGLVVSKNEGYRTVVAIRGLGLQANQNDVADPSVSLHVDGVYIPNDVSMNSELIDVERIEVLRGPQGTVFGQNSIGGAISITTKRPTLKVTQAEGDVSVGNYSMLRTRAMVNMPVGDTLAFRVAGDYDKHDGYGTNVLLGTHPDETDNASVHAQALWQPSDAFSAILRLTHFGTAHETGQLQKNILDTTPGVFNIAQGYPTSFYFNSNIYSLTLQYKASGVTLKSITSYQGETNLLKQDNGKTALQIDVVPRQNLFVRAVTQEFNIASNSPNAAFDWIVGAFFLNQSKHVQFLEFTSHDQGVSPINFTINPASPFSNPDLGFETDTTPQRKSTSEFAQGTFHVSDAFRVTAGARYTKDKVDSNVCNFFAAFGCTPLHFESSKVTGKVGLEWDVQPANLLYLTVSRGAKPGGTNLSFGLLVKPTYQDETVTSYEIGSKNRFLNNTLQLNAAAFHYDYKNLQFQNTDPKVFSGGVSNLGQSRVDGLELEWSALPTEHLRIDGNLAYLDTKITSSGLILDSVAANNITNALLAQGFSFFGPEIQAARATQLASPVGNPLPSAPQLVANLAVSYEWLIGGVGSLTSRVDVSHRDHFTYRVFNNSATDVVPSADQLNLFFGWKPAAGKWSAALVGTNITNRAIVSSRYTDSFGIGATTNQYLAPRLYMVRLGYKF